MDINTKLPINLESLLDLSAKLNETYDEGFILNAALLSLMGKLKIFRACILTPVNNDSQTAEPDYYKLALDKGKHGFDELPYFEAESFRQLNILMPGEEKLFNFGYRYCLPVKYRDRLLAVICLGKKLEPGKFSDEEYYYANLVATITGNALQNARNHISLEKAKNNVEKRNQLLTTLFEIAREFSSLLSKAEILKMLSYHLMGQLMVSRFAVFLINDEGGLEQIINRFDKIVPDNVIRELIKPGKMFLIDDIELKEEIRLYTDELNASVVAPMFVHGNVKGLLLIGSKMNGEKFGMENLLFLEALGNTAMAALENERLFHEELEKKRLESELTLALEIQRNLLPESVPDIPGYDVSGDSIPSRHVGGDYYDFIRLPGNKYMIAIADVSGKGMPAAILMANVQASLRAISPLELSLTEMISRINNIIYVNTTPDKFITFFFGILSPEDGTFRYLNAGHNPPFLLTKDGEVKSLAEGGIILGFSDEQYPYEEGEIKISREDVLLLYTDGITEAQNEHEREFGEEKLQSSLRQHSTGSSREIMDNIVNDIRQFAGKAPQTDDITLSVIKSL